MEQILEQILSKLTKMEENQKLMQENQKQMEENQKLMHSDIKDLKEGQNRIEVKLDDLEPKNATKHTEIYQKLNGIDEKLDCIQFDVNNLTAKTAKTDNKIIEFSKHFKEVGQYK